MQSLVTNIRFEEINEFDFMIKRTCTNRKIHTHEIGLHVHKQLEIYINLSGDVSFLVENNLYPVSYGDIIITQPGEYHHCVYNSDKEHNLFWILLDIDNNKDLFAPLLKGNIPTLIRPYKNEKNKIISLCEKMHSNKLSPFEKFHCLLSFISILKDSADNSSYFDTLPPDLHAALLYIDENICENIKVSDLANHTFISESTLTRRFKQYLGLKPLEFIQKKKILAAAELLKKGESVLSAGTSVGFADNSYFINLFKRFYKVTPSQYKRENHLL